MNLLNMEKKLGLLSQCRAKYALFRLISNRAFIGNSSISSTGLGRSMALKNKLFDSNLFSTLVSENAPKILRERLNENQVRNILVYSKAHTSSLAMNIIGILAAMFIGYVNYVSFQLFGSLKREVNDSADKNSFEKVLDIIGSENFRYIVCSTVGFVCETF
jgi:hypothetical protein